MIHCPHAHPYGVTYCSACAKEKAAETERQKVMDLINQRLTESHSRDVRMMLLRLKEEIK